MELAFLPEKSFMLAALALAREAGNAGEVPVGAVVEKDGYIIGRGRNRREETNNVLHHAEMLAISQACRALGTWRLSGCNLYVTLEPCPMCMGAILNARMETVVFGAEDAAAGCCGSAVDLRKLQIYAHPLVYRGYMEEDCRAVLKDFFHMLRRKKEE